MKVYLQVICMILVPALILSFINSCGQKKKLPPNSTELSINIVGSDTEYEMVKMICEEYKKNEKLNYTIEAGGSELGFNSLIKGEATIAMASREISEKEIGLMKMYRIEAVPVIFAIDALAIITHSKLGVDSLTLQQLSKIYNGEIKNWKLVGGPDLEIKLFTRNINSGTYTFFKNKIVHSELGNLVQTCANTADVVDSVSSNISGIGYVGAGFLMGPDGKPSSRIWAMPLSIDERHCAYSPFQQNEIKNGNYPITRPLYQYIKTPMNVSVKKLVSFELSAAGQDLVSKFGYFPITDYQRQINNLNNANQPYAN
jgi:phosphate transport system substrate-binding protein